MTWKRVDAYGSSYHMNKVTLRVAAGRGGNPSMFWCLGRDVVKAGKLKFGGIEIILPPDFYEDWKYPDADDKDKVARLRGT